MNRCVLTTVGFCFLKESFGEAAAIGETGLPFLPAATGKLDLISLLLGFTESHLLLGLHRRASKG